MKIGVFADTHIGRCVPRAIGELRRQAYRHAFTQAVDVFIQEGIDYLIHAGDMFEKRSMTPEDSVFVKDELQRLVDSIRNAHGKDVVMFAVRGNHDGTPESNALDYIKHPLAKYLKIVGDGTLQGRDEAQFLDDLCIVGVAYHPYISRRFENVRSTVKSSFAEKSGLKLLVIHNFIEGYHQIPPGVPPHSFLTTEMLRDLGADVVVAGHYHPRKEPRDEDGTILFTPGATEAVDLSDEGSYGVHILEGEEPIRFIPIMPLHEIHNIKVVPQEAVKPTSWFINKASREARAYASSVQAREVEGILRLVLIGLTDEDPYSIEQTLTPEFAKIRRASPRLLHVELVNRVDNIQQISVLPTLGGGEELALEILRPLGELAPDAMKIVEGVRMALDERASQTTGLLTGSDRAAFVSKWVDVLEKVTDRD